MEKTVEQIASEINEKLAKSASKEELGALKTEVANLVDKGLVTKEDHEKLDADIQKAFETLETLKKVNNKSDKNVIAKFEMYKNITKDGKQSSDYEHAGVIKAENDVIHNLFVINGDTFENDEANADAALLTLTAGAPRFSERQSSNAEFVNTVASLAEPVLIGEAIQAVVGYDETGGADDVDEAMDKPIVAEKLKVQKVEAVAIAHIWYETLQFINRMGVYRTFLSRNIMARFMDVLANKLMTKINSLAASWALPTGFNLVPDPNNYDALTALAT